MLVEALAAVGKEECFALYGGTAINFFLLDAPRLSVDLDLRYALPLPYQEGKSGIGSALQRIGAELDAGTGIKCSLADHRRMEVARTHDDVRIKIEANDVVVGTIFPTQRRLLAAAVAKRYRAGMPVQQQLLATAEIYAGKLMAMLERRHPRDLYDVHMMSEDIWRDEKMWTALAVSLAMSRHRQLHLLLANDDFAMEEGQYRELALMVRQGLIAKAELAETGRSARARVVDRMPALHRRILVDFFNGEANWAELGIVDDDLPGLNWRQENVQKMPAARRREIVSGLKDILDV